MDIEDNIKDQIAVVLSLGCRWLCEVLMRLVAQDIPRTFPCHLSFNEDNSDKLKRVLHAVVASQSRGIGYCQVDVISFN